MSRERGRGERGEGRSHRSVSYAADKSRRRRKEGREGRRKEEESCRREWGKRERSSLLHMYIHTESASCKLNKNKKKGRGLGPCYMHCILGGGDDWEGPRKGNTPLTLAFHTRYLLTLSLFSHVIVSLYTHSP
jgi:hypothetical protein